MLPLALPRKSSPESNNIHVLAADIGGTKTSLGLFKSKDERMYMLYENTYHSKDFPSFEAMTQQFLNETKQVMPHRLSIGVAGPVLHGKVETANLPWKIDAHLLTNETGVKEVALINDLESTAYGLAGIEEKDIEIINRIEKRVARDKYINISELNNLLQQEIEAILVDADDESHKNFEIPLGMKPYVILVVGVNGVGKTTTIGKLAHHYKKAGKQVIIGAGPEFLLIIYLRLFLFVCNQMMPLTKFIIWEKCMPILRKKFLN
jgi:hypothetical protein